MTRGGSVTGWVARLQAGDQEAAQKLWDRYFQRLLGLVRQKLKGRILETADEQDVAASAFASFWKGVQAGRFPDLKSRDNVWALLIRITTCKALDHIHYDDAPTRPHGREDRALDYFLGREVPPAAAAQMAEEFQRLLDKLEDPVLQSIALWKLEGFTNQEIADKLSQGRRIQLRTVERKLERIRAVWAKEVAP